MTRIIIALFCLPFLVLLTFPQLKQAELVTINITPFPARQNIQNIAQSAMAFRDDLVSAETIGRIADLSWNSDEEYARSLFRISLTKTAVGQSDSEKEAASKRIVSRKLFGLIAKHDPLWARRLIDSFAEDPKKKTGAKLQVAADLLDTDPAQAADLAKQSLQDDINRGFLSFLKNLRQKDENQANQLFLQLILRSVQTNYDAREYALFGTYLFRSSRVTPSDGDQSVLMIVVGDILMPDISGNRTNVPPDLIRAYIRNAISLLNGIPGDSEQRKVKYALAHLLVPKAQELAPDLSGELLAAMHSLASFVPAEFTGGDAYKYLNKKPTPPRDRIEEIEKLTDSNTRDQLFLDVVYWAYRRDDFEIAKLATSKIDDKKLQSELEILVAFGETNALLKTKSVDLNEAIRRIEKVPEGLEKCLLWLAVAAIADKMKNKEFLISSLDSARGSAHRITDDVAPFLLLHISGEMKAKAYSQADTVLAEATKSFNRFDGIKDPSFERKITMSQTLRFPLPVKDVNLGFQSSFLKAVKGDEENAVLLVNDIADERLKGMAYVSLAKAILAKKPTVAKLEIQEKIVIVDEKGIRRSAVKAIMPVYPTDSLKKKISGVAVAEIQFNGEGNLTDVKILESPDSPIGKSVADAMRQWTFKPSQLEGKPISVRGKITFYFSINERGKGEVKNPKQFQ